MMAAPSCTMWVAIGKIANILFLQLMLTWYRKDGTLAKQGCGFVVNNSLTSPGYPNNYPNNTDCNYYLPIPKGTYMKISFAFFNLEDGKTSCGFDFLKITNEVNKEFATFCGTNYWPLEVTGAKVVITFHSDHKNQGKGFLIHFSPSRLKGCDSGVINNTLKSPGYPDNYPNYTECQYHIPIPPNMTMNITFVDFDVEQHEHCDYDYLKITNDKNSTVGVYCGQKTGWSVLLTGDYVGITFHTDDIIEARGFSINFNAVPHGCGPEKDNTVKSPGYPTNYPPNTDCFSWIPIPQGMAVFMSFNDFELEYSESCKRDYLKISDEQGQELKVYCGTQTGRKVRVTGNNIMIKFHSDDSLHKRGFLIDFTAIPLRPTVVEVANQSTQPSNKLTRVTEVVPTTWGGTTQSTQRNDKPDKKNVVSSQTITYISFGVTIILLVLCFALCFWWSHRKRKIRSTRPLREIIPLDKWELLPEQIECKEELGRGAFGVVYKATLKRRVGIKVFDTK